jgi:hypothetical protein
LKKNIFIVEKDITVETTLCDNFGQG